MQLLLQSPLILFFPEGKVITSYVLTEPITYIFIY